MTVMALPLYRLWPHVKWLMVGEGGGPGGGQYMSLVGGKWEIRKKYRPTPCYVNDKTG